MIIQKQEQWIHEAAPLNRNYGQVPPSVGDRQEKANVGVTNKEYATQLQELTDVSST